MLLLRLTHWQPVVWKGQRGSSVTLRRMRRTALAAALLILPAAGFTQEGLDLEEAIQMAVARNERAAIADQLVEAADARVKRARAFFFPDLTITSNYTRRGYETVRTIDDEEVTIQSFNATSSAAVINQTVFDARAFPLYRYSRLLRDSATFGAAEDKRLLAFEAAGAFITTLSLEQVVAAAERRRNFAQTNVNDARARFEAGLVSSNDVTRAELELATAEREAARARGSAQTAYLQLGNLLKTEVQGPLEVPQNLLTQASEQPAGDSTAIDQARNRRLDV